MNKPEKLQQIGGRLSICRQNRSMTQEELANRLGITPQALSKWERGVSLPDTAMLPDIARILEISVDYLLGVSRESSTGQGDSEIRHMIGENLRNSLEPLELVFGEGVLPLFTDEQYVEEIKAQRLQLSREGFLLPVLRIRDALSLEEQEFRILSYRKILYAEKLACIDEQTLHYMAERLGACVREKYYEIVNPDLLKEMVENLKIKYPALIEGVVPERISYHLLTDMVRRILRRGGSIVYLPKIIEIMDCVLEWHREVSPTELEEEIFREYGCFSESEKPISN